MSPDGGSDEATYVELRAVSRGTRAELDTGSFWQHLSFAELQRARGTTGLVDPDALAMPDITDDERAAFLAALDS